MQENYKLRIMKRFMSQEELDEFDKKYRTNVNPSKKSQKWYYTHEEIKAEVDLLLKELGWKKKSGN